MKTLLCVLGLGTLVFGSWSCRGSDSTGAAVPSPSSSSAAAALSSSGATKKSMPEGNLVIPAASVSAFRNPNNLPPYSGPTGSIEGTITVTGDPPPDTKADFSKCPLAQVEYGKLFREGQPRPDGSRPLADAIVGVTGYSGFYVPDPDPVRSISIEDCGFSSRTVDMTIGQTLEVQNKTKRLYAPTLVQIDTPALMVATPGGDPVKLYPAKPGYYTLIDRIGADYMTANVYVVAYPLHAVSGLDGHYRIDGVPVGNLRVSARLAAIQKTTSAPIDVHANVVEHVDLQLNYRQPNKGATPVQDGSVAPKTL
jgi:hypothetical protein